MSNSGSSNNSSNSKASNNKNQSKNNVKQGNNNSRNLKQQQLGNRFKRTSPTTKNNAESNNEQPKKEQKRREKEEEIARASHNSSKSKRQRAGKNNKRTVEMNHNNSVGDKQQDNEQGTGIVGVGHNDSESNEQQVIGKGKRKAGVSHNNLENDKQQAIGKGKRNIGVGHNNLASDKQQAKESGKSKSGAGKDNSGSNKLQQAGEKVGKTADEVQSTTKGVKDTASLVTNATTGNIPGAAVDAVKVITNKKFMKKVAFIIMLPIIIILAIILLLLLFLYMIITDLGGRVQEIADTSQDTSEYATVRESDGAILISDEQIDKLIAAIEESGVDLDAAWLMGDLESNGFPTEEDYQIAKRKYIRKFYEAQLTTETLNYFHTESTDTMTYGSIYVYRIKEQPDGTSIKIKLTYIPYLEMLEYQASGSDKAFEHFTIDGSGNLVVAGSIETIVEEGSNVNELSETSDVLNITLSIVDYKSAIAQYTTKMNFLVYLTMISQNPEFVSALTDLIKDTKIDITIMDNITTTITTETFKCIVHSKVKDIEMTEDGVETSGKYNYSQRVETDITKTTVIEKQPAFNPTYVKTWFCEQSISYAKKTDLTDNTYPVEVNPVNDPEPSTSGTWITGRTKYIQETEVREKWEEAWRTEVKIILGERGDGQKYQDGDIDTPTFIGLMETPFRIPNTTREERPAGNLLSGAEWLFQLLQQDPDLENMEILMRYAFYLYSGKDYGVTEIDGSIFDIGEFTPISSGVLGDVEGVGSVERQIIDFLLSKGVPKVGIAAIMGNIQAESSFNPGTVNEIGCSGLIQWKGSRFEALQEMAADNNVEWTDVNIQMEYMWHELETVSTYKKVKSIIMYTTDESQLEYVTWYWARYYEVAFSWSNNFEESKEDSARRYRYAQEWYQKITQPGAITGDGSTADYSSVEDIKKYNLNVHNNYIEYKQGDYDTIPPRYNATGSYGTIKAKGCLPTCISIILSGMGVTDSNGQIYTPESLIVSGTIDDISSGSSNESNARKTFNKVGLTGGARNSTSGRANDILSNLEAGNAILVHASTGYYTSGGHYMALIDVNGNNVYLSNPGSRSKNGWVNINTLISRNVDWYMVVSR